MPRAEEAGALRRTADCFDFCRNWHQLMAKPQMGRELDLTTLNGFRAVSMFWVILGHTLSYIVWIGGIAYPGRLINPNNMNMVLHDAPLFASPRLPGMGCLETDRFQELELLGEREKRQV